MDPLYLSIIIGAVSLIAGLVAGKFLFTASTKKQLEEAEAQAQKIISDAQATAETLKKEKLLEAKERFVQLKAEHDKEVLERNKKIAETEARIRSTEQSLNSKNGNLDKQIKENEAIKENLNRQI
ncbi:MAG: Rnase Y domain-containing protein, partial [Chitinophagaceae bacterium]|nr:Rnase Y domain-containing protein [Chitinophagaceae bacterium]